MVDIIIKAVFENEGADCLLVTLAKHIVILFQFVLAFHR